MYFIESLLPGMPEVERPMPTGLVTLRIDRKTGEPVSSGGDAGDTEMEVFRKALAPSSVVVGGATRPRRQERTSGESLF